MQLKGQVALITGGGTGIGAEIAAAMTQAGATVVLMGRRSEALSAAAARLPAEPGQVLTVTGDVSNPADPPRVVAEALERFGRVDVLVNNAGIVGWHGPLAEMPLAEWDRVISTNLTGTFLCSQAVVPAMVRQGGGAIINISSVCGVKAWKGLSAYGASKAGMNMLTKTMALDYAAQEIRVNAICPGTVLVAEGPAPAPGTPEALQLERLAQRYPLGRVGRPADIAPLAVLLASPDSRWITGSVFTIDGGLTA